MFNFLRNVGIGEWIFVGVIILLIISNRKSKKEEDNKDKPSTITPEKDGEGDTTSEN